MKFIPFFRDRQRVYWQSRRQSRKKDTTGEHVDNIFRLDKHKRN